MSKAVMYSAMLIVIGLVTIWAAPGWMPAFQPYETAIGWIALVIGTVCLMLLGWRGLLDEDD